MKRGSALLPWGYCHSHRCGQPPRDQINFPFDIIAIGGDMHCEHILAVPLVRKLEPFEDIFHFASAEGSPQQLIDAA